MKENPVIFCLLVIALLLGTLSVCAEDTLDLQIRRTNAEPFSDQIGYTVNVYVSASDQNGSPVLGLNADHFKLYEDSVLQSLTGVRSVEDEPVSLVLLMDESGSMLGQNFFNKEAVSRFLQKLSRYDYSAVIGFNERISVLQRFTNDHAASGNAVLSAKAENGRGSCLYDAVYEGLELALSRTEGRRAVVLFTDGTDELANGDICSTRPLSDVLNFSIQNHIPIFTMGIGDRTNDKELQRIAETSGGRFAKITAQNDPDPVLTNIYHQLYQEYKLTYRTGSSAGQHTLLAEAEKDGLYGKDSTPVTLPVMPTIMRFQSPEEGAELQNETLLSVAFITQSAEVANVEYFCNGQYIGKVITYPYTFSWDISQMAPGTVILKAIAYNKDNQELAQASRMIFIQEPGQTVPTAVPTEVPTAVPVPTAIPPKAEKDAPGSIVFICLGALGAAVVILVILLTQKKSSPEPVVPLYYPPVNYGTFYDKDAAAKALDTISGEIPSIASLEVISSSDQSFIRKVFKVEKLPLTMGRSPDNGFVFPQEDRAVGRHHAALEELNGQIVIRDLNSRYGTFVNEKQIDATPMPLEHGDTIRLGSNTALKFILTQKRSFSSDTADEENSDIQPTMVFRKKQESEKSFVTTILKRK